MTQPPSVPTAEAMLDALQRIALLADSRALTWRLVSEAVAIATSTLRKSPSQIHAERQGTADGQVFRRPAQPTREQGHAPKKSTLSQGEGQEEPWLIRKSGCFYRPNRAGYTTHVFEAGRYTREEAEDEAKLESRISAHPLSDFQEEVPRAEAVARKIVNDWYEECSNPEEDEPPQFAWPKLIQRIAEALLQSVSVSAPHCWFMENARDSTGPFDTKEEALAWAEMSGGSYKDWQPIPLFRQPVSAPGVMVTDEMIMRVADIIKDYRHTNDATSLWDTARDALSAALRPKE